MPRCVSAVLILCLSGLAILSACSETTKFRVLSFFFDGVPGPGAARAAEQAIAGVAPTDVPAATPGQVVTRPAFRAHPPYHEGRCGGCHDPTTGQLFRTSEEGLCASCHGDLVRDFRYLHGPVAVSACLFCHHHHGGVFPKVLRSDPAGICFRCHQRKDLTEGEHHATIEQQACVECHDAHGGNDRFFLRRAER